MADSQALSDLLVVDLSQGMAAPLSTMLLADFGAAVVKVERPDQGEMGRQAGWQINGTSVWWYLLARNKHVITLDLKKPRGQQLLLKLLDEADVLVENMRPGKLEAMGLAPEKLWERNRGLVILRVTGWGQDGPYAGQPTYGTQAEAMSGLAFGTGDRGGPPMLPSFTIADPVTGYLSAFSMMVALWARERDPERRGQVIDMSLFEALFGLLGPQASAYDKLGVVQGRIGSRSPFFAPRNIYRAQDGRYVAISGGAQHIVRRFLNAIGRPELIEDPRFSTPAARFQHADELDDIMQDWIGQHDSATVIATFNAADATVAPVYSIEDIFDDEHFRFREVITTVETAGAGTLKMQNAFPRLSRTPGQVRWAGRPPGADNDSWLKDKLGLSAEDMDDLKRDGTI